MNDKKTVIANDANDIFIGLVLLAIGPCIAINKNGV